MQKAFSIIGMVFKIIRKVVAAVLGLFTQGLFLWGNIEYGYTTGKIPLVITEKVQAIYRNVFLWVFKLLGEPQSTTIADVPQDVWNMLFYISVLCSFVAVFVACIIAGKISAPFVPFSLVMRAVGDFLLNFGIIGMIIAFMLAVAAVFLVAMFAPLLSVIYAIVKGE